MTSRARTRYRAAMPTHLPLVKPHRREHTYCAYCPKLCRFSCPVSTVQARETTTPWGKMTSLHHVAEGNLPHSEAYATTWYACTGCQRCKSFCDHDNDVSAALQAGRAEALAAETAPAAAVEVAKEHTARESRARNAATQLFGTVDTRSTGVAYAPGCTACVLRPAEAQAGYEVIRHLSGSTPDVVAGGCCGLPLLDAGDRNGFLEAARRYLWQLQDAETAVFLDPGCLHALKVRAPELGLEHRVAMKHFTEFAAEHRERLSTRAQPTPLRFQDPCRLGRGLGVYEAPRQLLEQISGTAPIEFHQSREHAECSGYGGQVPRTDRPTAEAIARERVTRHAEEGGGTIVTACPGSAYGLARASADTPVIDIASLVLDAL